MEGWSNDTTKKKRKKKIKINRKIDIRWSYELLVDLSLPVATNEREFKVLPRVSYECL